MQSQAPWCTLALGREEAVGSQESGVQELPVRAGRHWKDKRVSKLDSAASRRTHLMAVTMMKLTEGFKLLT